MAALTWDEKLKQKTLYEIGYNYLVQNFSKFKEDNKIRIALDVISIFNKDGSKTQGNKQIIYVIANDRDSAERGAESLLQVPPSQITEHNPQKQEPI